MSSVSTLGLFTRAIHVALHLVIVLDMRWVWEGWFFNSFFWIEDVCLYLGCIHVGHVKRHSYVSIVLTLGLFTRASMVFDPWIFLWFMRWVLGRIRCLVKIFFFWWLGNFCVDMMRGWEEEVNLYICARMSLTGLHSLVRMWMWGMSKGLCIYLGSLLWGCLPRHLWGLGLWIPLTFVRWVLWRIRCLGFEVFVVGVILLDMIWGWGRRNSYFAFVRGCLLSELHFVVRTWMLGKSRVFVDI